MTALCSVIFAITAADVSAQNGGSIYGIVFNESTDATLEGARVVVVPGNHTVYVARGGRYRVSGLDAGEYTVKVSYTGMYQKSQTVSVESNVSVRSDFALSGEIYELSEFTITGEREGSAAAITYQRNAYNIVNILDSDAFGSIAKANIGNFLQRVPGLVGLQGEVDVSKISVRGFAPHLSEVQFDGNLVAHAETQSNNREVRIDALQAQLVKRVEVTKAPTPDMSAGSAGGTVNLISKTAFDFAEDQKAGFSLGLIYDAKFGEAPDPTFNVYYSKIFGEKKNIGLVLIANRDEITTVRATTRMTVEEDWDFTSDYSVRWDRTGYDIHNQTRTGVSAVMDFRLSDVKRSMLHTKLSYTRYDDNMFRNRNRFQSQKFEEVIDRFQTAWSDIQYDSQRNLRDETTEDWNAMIAGEHELGDYELEYTVSYGKSKGTEIRKVYAARSNEEFAVIVDRRGSVFWPDIIITDGVDPLDDDFSNVRIRDADRINSKASDEVWNARASIKRYFNTENPIYLKAGFEFRKQTKVRDDNEERYKSNGTIDASMWLDTAWDRLPSDGHYPLWPHLLIDPMFESIDSDPDLWTFEAENSLEESLEDDTTLEESIFAAYIMGGIDIGRLSITTGVRFESTDVKGEAPLRDPNADTVAEEYGLRNRGSGSYDDLFPSIHLKWEPINDLIVRASVNTSIGRPDLGDIIPDIEVDEIDEKIDKTNPGLLPQSVTSYEISVEKYFEPAGLISISFFRKEIDDFIVDQNSTVGSGPGNGFDGLYEGFDLETQVNGGSATIDGIEINYQHQLSFLPGIWKGLAVFANYTFLDTKGDYDGDGKDDGEIEDFRPRTGNLGVSYSLGRFSGRVQANYVGKWLDNKRTLSDPSDDRIFDDRFVVDVNTRWRLNKRFTLFLDLTNVTTEHILQYLGTPERHRQTQMQGRTITFGILANF